MIWFCIYVHHVIFPIFCKTNKIASVFVLCYKFVALLISNIFWKKLKKIRFDSPQKKIIQYSVFCKRQKKILIIIIIDVPHLKCYNVTYCCDIREAPFETHELLSWVVGGDGAAVEVAAVVIDADDGIIIIPEWQTMLARQVTTLNSLSSDWLTSKYFHKYDVALIKE